MEIRNLEQAEKILAKYRPLAHEITGKDITLERMAPLMKYLGNPENKLRVIHVAGTSGKTSTCYYIASLLGATGKKVGLTVSPHMDSITERIQINLKPLNESEFCKVLSEFMDLIYESKVVPTYYELLIAFVYWYFDKVRVDYAVIETGLGGLQDCTNIARNPSKVCVITDIGYDHMKVLGNTITAIARQKAGIVHSENKVIMYEQTPEVMAVFNNWCSDKNADLRVLKQDKEIGKLRIDISALPSYQQRNWQLAYAAYCLVAERDSLLTLDPQQLEATRNTYIPGRMDEVIIGNKIIVMDGAHNTQKMAAFVESFQKKYSGHKADILLAVKASKDYKQILPILRPICRRLILTTFKVVQERTNISTETKQFAAEAKKCGFEEIINEPDLKIAYKLFLSSSDRLGVITGSLFLLSQVRANNKELRHVQN